MSFIKDLSDLRFGKLYVRKQTPSKNDKGEWQWVCDCICGNVTTVRGYCLRRGSTTSCGCSRGENGKVMWTKHGKSRVAEYGSWISMIRRCNDEGNEKYADYGGRGIEVCSRWLSSIDCFISDMGPRPSEKHTIDRIDTNGNYEPGNCRWATPEEQSNNRDLVDKFDYNGEQLSISQIARINNIPYSSLYDRVKRYGMTMEIALKTPFRRKYHGSL